MSLHVEVKIDVILHATENQEKIFDSLLENFDIKRENLHIQNLTGHFDNPITLASTNLKKESAKTFVIKFFDVINTLAKVWIFLSVNPRKIAISDTLYPDIYELRIIVLTDRSSDEILVFASLCARLLYSFVLIKLYIWH